MSVVAIVFATLIPLIIERYKAKSAERAIRIREASFSFSYLAATRELQSSLNMAMRRFAKSESEEDLPDIIKELVVPEMLSQSASNLHELGEVGVHLQAAIVAMTKAKDRMEYQVFYSDSGGQAYEVLNGLEDLSPPKEFFTYLKRSKVLIDRVMESIESRHPLANPEKPLDANSRSFLKN